MKITWKLWDCDIARVEANIIMQYYLFPHSLSTHPRDNDHFAHFADE